MLEVLLVESHDDNDDGMVVYCTVLWVHGIFTKGRNTSRCIFVKVYKHLPILQSYKELFT